MKILYLLIIMNVLYKDIVLVQSAELIKNHNPNIHILDNSVFNKYNNFRKKSLFKSHKLEEQLYKGTTKIIR